MITAQMKNEVKQRDGFKCVRCQSEDELTIDHVIPSSRGGKDTKDNLQTLCGRCNRRKGNHIQWSWVERLDMALHIDEHLTNIRNDIRSGYAGLGGAFRDEVKKAGADIRSLVGIDVSELRKTMNGQAQTIAFMEKQIRALEAHMKVKWVEESFEGYKKIK